MSKTIQKKKIISIMLFLFFFFCVSICVLILSSKNVQNRQFDINEEEIMKLLATRQENTEESGEDIDFKVFFLRDTDGDGYSEELSEVYRELGTTDTLFVDLNIKTQGYLKNGEITLETGGNFKWRTTLVESNIIKGDYIGETNNIKLQNNLANGTQVLLYGTVIDDIRNNIYNFDKTSTMKLIGTFVDEDGNETPIEKVQKVTMNWYGETATTIQSTSQSYNIDNAISGETFNATFNVNVEETKRELLLQKQEAVVTIPEVNGYKPTSVVVNSSNVTSNYDEETGILTISRDADVDIDGNIVKSVARNNSYNITVKYPIEAFTESGKETLEIEIPITGTNYGFNNDEYMNPHITSDITTIKVNYYKNNSEVAVIKPIFNLYTYVGTYARTDYRVSKNGPINLYNGNVNDEKDQYPVVWQAYVGDYSKIKALTLEEKNNDKFNNSDSMYEYVTTTGVYFSDPASLLGKSGQIELYNAEDGTLIKTFKKDTWNNYTSVNPFKTNVKSIKIVTSKPINSGSLYVYQIKEIDDEKLTKKEDNIGYTLEEFESLKRIYTYLEGTASAPSNVIYGNDETTLTKSVYNSALYDMPYSVVDLNTSLVEITNQKANNMNFIINTSAANSFERIWKNGVFVIELPENIINVDIKNVNISNADVEIISSIVYEENGKRFIRIDTKNENESVYKITLNADVYGNPLLGDSTEKIKLYAFNKYCDNYLNKTLDIYDIDGDLLTTDNVGYSEKTIKIRAPQGIITTEYVSDYDENNSITIAPNIAEIERADEKRKATINVSIANNYANIIDEIKILGKVPFEGNTYVLNGQNQELGSEYTACIDSEIRMSDELKEYATVYYTDVEKPTVDLSDSSNNWSTEVTDWSNVKNYLIDLGDYVLTRNANEIFSYDVYVPEKLGYNSASYSAHAVYYSLQTDDAGKYQTSTQPNKVGIQVVGKYNLEVVKNKANQDNIFVAGATYSLTTKVDDKDVSQIATTDENGKLIFKKIYIGREYTLKEISSPENYELNEKEIKFKTKLDDTEENLIVEQIENNFSSDPVVTIDENGNYYVKSTVEDESKITLRINTINTEGEKIKDVKYDITKDSKITTYTNELKDIEIPDYSVDKEAKLKQTKADGYYLKQGDWPFTIVRDEETHKLKIVTEDDEIRNAVIEEDIDGQTIVTITIVNERIPTYNLKIVKIEEVKNSEDEVELLKGAQFRLYSYDLDENQFASIDDKNGVTIDNLYTYIEGKYISGRYILQEIEAPGGYCNNTEEIIFSVEKNEEEELSLKIENQDDLISVYNYEIVDNTVKIYIQDKPLFRLEKRDSATGELLSNAKFVIYELDDELNEVDYAKDINGNYVGIQDESGDYIVTTNDEGEIILPLRAGLYLIKEVSYPEGYQENDVKNIFRIAGADDIGTAEMDDEDSEIKIQYIEDLVELSNNVNSGKKYSNKNIVLERDLDFNDPSSYRSNVVDQTLITGEGFTPIGKDANNYFDGTFDGNNHKIENLYQNIEDPSMQYSGLFGYISKAEIYNLDISGDITVNSQNKAIGSIVGYANESKISNCNSICTINDLNGAINKVGGIVGNPNATIISYCTNGGDITKNNIKGSVSVGGIAGQKTSQETLYCSNMGNITCTFEDKGTSTATYEVSVGGLVGNNSGEVKNSNNTGNITINNNNQITKYTEYVGGLFGKSYGSINESYNLGNITNQINDAQKNVGYEGGLVGYYSGHNSTLSNENAIVKCYNIGTIKGTNYVGGLIGNYISSVMYTKSAIKDSYNIGDISGNYSGGIVGIVRYGRSVHYKLTNCYNSSRITGTYAGEILGNVEIRNSGTNQWITSTTIENCYYLENSIDSENITSKGTVMSEEAMKDIEFVNTLNDTSQVWKSDSTNINNGYPVLDITESSAEEQYITGIVEINYIEDLVELANNVNKGISYKSANVILMRNLDFNDADSYRSNEVDQSLISGTGFEPIGYSSAYAFNGIFDGNGKTIKNLYIMNPPFTYGLILHIGLFGYTNNAKIENLNLEDVNLSGSAPTSSNYKSYVGALVSYAVDTAIKNCSTSGTVKTGNGRAGIVNNGTRTTIEDCVNNVNFIGGGDSYTAGTYPVGGICYSLTNGTIKRCANKGHVDSGTTSFSGGILYSGSNSDIYYSYNTGEVNGVGIVLSASNCRIAGCYNTGEVKLAGIASSISGTSSIYKCYNSGNVSSAGDIVHVGGIVRYINNTGTVSNCYNTGNIVNTYSNASYSGGIVGYVNGTATVKNCYNSGNINDTTSNSYAGGIIGYSNKSTITDCYNTGTIEINSTYDTAGIIGNSNKNDTITNTYNIGNIIIDSQSRSTIGGGISAINVANEIQNSYYLKDSIKTIEYPSSKDGIPLESSEMITKDFYDTLNVNNVWKYNKDNYPTLKNMDLILGDIPEVTELRVENTIKKFNITTEIINEDGGTVEAQGEIVEYGKNNVEDYVITSNDGYEILSITINGKEILLSDDNRTSYTIPKDYFTNVIEDKNIVITFSASDEIFELNKVDKNDLSKKLEGAKYIITSDPRQDDIELGEPVNDCTQYKKKNDDKKVEGVIGSMQPTETVYTFVQNSDGSISSNNQGKSGNNNIACVYYEVDLTGKEGTYFINLDYSVSADYYYSESNEEYTYYAYGFAMVTTEPRTNNKTVPTASQRFLYAVRNTNSTAYSAYLEGGQKYYLYIGYRGYSVRNNFTDTLTVRNINVYEPTTYEFEKVDDKYISSNQGIDSTNSSICFPIDLREKNGKYDLTVNAEISSQSNGDYGYAIVNQSPNAVTASTTSGRFIYISGEKPAEDYTTVLDGGNLYYLHFGYSKNTSNSSGTDAFTINDINVSLNRTGYMYEELTTDENGKIKLEVPGDTELYIQEIKAPDEYILDENIYSYKMIPGDSNNSLTLTNSLRPKLIVHHYYEGTNNMVAEDEVYIGNIGEEYSATPKLDLDKLELATDQNGNYILPDKMNGIYDENDIEVTFYYKLEPVRLTIHHYFEGTENKLVEDEIVETQSNITFGVDGKYSVTTDATYELENNENYNQLKDENDFVGVTSSLDKDLTIEDTFEYTKDEEITYYYKIREYEYTVNYFYNEIKDEEATVVGKALWNAQLTGYESKPKAGYAFKQAKALDENGEETELPLTIKEDVSKNVINVYYNYIYNVTTKVKEHLEYNSDGESYSVKGGSISGENEEYYEEILFGNSNEKSVVITPDEGYSIAYIYINGNKIDVPNPDEEFIIPEGYFTNVNEDKHIEVCFSNLETTLIIEKEDEEGNKLEGAKFKITTDEKIPEIAEMQANGDIEDYDFQLGNSVNNTLGEIVQTGDVRKAEAEKGTKINGIITEVESQNYDYSFDENDGKYISNNKNKSSSNAKKVFLVDLSQKEGNYVVNINAKVSSEGNYDIGYATVTDSLENENINSENDKFIYISGEIDDTDYCSKVLTGGNIYYLHIGYKKDSSGDRGDDEFTINSIDLYECLSWSQKRYGFDEVEGKYISNNQNTVNKNAYAYKTIDLTNKEGQFVLIVNAEIPYNSSSYMYVIVSESENIPSYYDEEGRLLYVEYNTLEATEFKYILEGGKKYYLHFGCYASSSSVYDDKLVINSVNVYEATNVTINRYGFYKNNSNIYESNNHKDNSIGASYIPIDLREYEGEYTLIVNAQISSESGCDNGYATIESSIETPDYYSCSNRFIDISGETEATDYTYILEGGNIYYLHFAYQKDGSVGSGEDSFKINSIKFKDTNEEFFETTDKNGLAIVNVKKSGKYIITEIESPQGYILDNTPKDIEVGLGKENTITLTNKKQPILTVHHYLKENGEYTIKPLADDEVYQDNPGNQYETTFLTNLINLQIEKDGEGNNVIPENATGVYGEENIDVYYYYEPRKIDLTIHHYLEGTSNKIVEDEIISIPLEVYLDEDGKYKVSDKCNYELKLNSNYNDLIENYNLTSVFTLAKENAQIENTIYFNTNTEIMYFYKEIEHYEYSVHYFYNDIEDPTKTETLTARYEDEIKTYEDKGTGYIFIEANASDEEGNMNDLPITEKPLVIGTDSSKNIINVYYKSAYTITARVKDEKGGTVKNAANEDVNETVLYGENNEDKIIITPDSGYDVTNIIINTYDENGTKISEESLDIDSFKDSNGIITIPEEYFENMTSNKEVVVEFKKKTSVTVKYLEKDTNEVMAPQVLIEGYEDDIYNVTSAVVDGYRLAQVETNDGSMSSVTFENNDKFDVNAENKMDENAITIIFWYEPIPEGTIIVKHIEIDANNVENEIEHESYSGESGDTQETSRKEYTDDKTGRNYIAVNGPSSENANIIAVSKDDTTYIVTFEENENGEIDPIEVRYYYQRTYNITANIKEHTEIVDGIEKSIKGGTIQNDENQSYETETVIKSGSNSKVLTITPDTNYRIKSVKINGDIIFVEDLLDDNNVLTIPAGYFSDITEDKNIEVEFERIPAKVIVRYLVDQEDEEKLSEDIIKLGVVGENYETEVKEIAGYELVESRYPNNSEGQMTVDDIIVIYYYKKITVQPEEPEIPGETQEPEIPDEPEVPEDPDAPEEPNTDPIYEDGGSIQPSETKTEEETPVIEQSDEGKEPNVTIVYENENGQTTNTNRKYKSIKNIKTGDDIIKHILAFISSVIIGVVTVFRKGKNK